jgi:Putative metallopeptidase
MPQRFRENVFNICLITALLIVILGCVCQSTKDRSSANQADSPTVSNNINSYSKIKSDAGEEKKYQDVGDFVVEYAAQNSSRYSEIDSRFRDEKVLENAAAKLNKSVALPKDITLQTNECGEINAFYDPNNSTIIVCYELMEHFFTLFQNSGKSESDSYDLMFDATRFVFLHELGHALIDVHDIPVAGSEEDAADRLSTYICLEQLGEEGANSTIAAAQAFSIESKDSKENPAFYDNHKLGQQRFYDIMCSLYGFSKTKYADVVTEGLLPKDRAVSCENEYKKLVNSWGKLLSPLRKK